MPTRTKLLWIVIGVGAPLYLCAGGLVGYFLLQGVASTQPSGPEVAVEVALAEASPLDVESVVTIPLEEVLSGMPGVKTIEATSREEAASVRVRFSPGIDPDLALATTARHLRDLILTDRAGAPEVTFADRPRDRVITVVLSGAEDLAALSAAGCFLLDQINATPGVSAVTLEGDTEKEVAVEVDEDRLAASGLSVEDLVRQLKNALADPASRLPVGELSGLALRRERQEIAAISLKDVARVEVGLRERSTIVRLDGDDAVALLVRKHPAADLDEVRGAVEKLCQKAAGSIPPGLRLTLMDLERSPRAVVRLQVRSRKDLRTTDRQLRELGESLRIELRARTLSRVVAGKPHLLGEAPEGVRGSIFLELRGSVDEALPRLRRLRHPTLYIRTRRIGMPRERFAVALSGLNRNALAGVAAQVAELLHSVEGLEEFEDVVTGAQEAQHTMELTLRKNDLAKFGLDASDVGTQLVLLTGGSLFVGDCAAGAPGGRGTLPVFVKTRSREGPSWRDAVLKVGGGGGPRRIPVTQIADIKLVRNPVLQRRNGERALTMHYTVKEPASEKDLRATLEKIDLPAGVALSCERVD